MEAQTTMRRTVALWRDIAIGAASLCAGSLHTIGGRWMGVGIALAAASAWIIFERRRVPQARWVAPAALLAIGTLLIWRFSESRLWITASGIWFLTVSADLSRLVLRFPTDASRQQQRDLIGRRIAHLLLIGAGGAAMVAAGRVLSFQVRLVSVALLALFVVMVIGRTIVSVAHGGFPREDDEVGR